MYNSILLLKCSKISEIFYKKKFFSADIVKDFIVKEI